MKTVRRVDSTSQSCSCTSCLYKSESEQPSIRKYVAHGSRIDRLYFGKYIPLRERKLLNRLVRTRAVYDDLRARLISDSTLSLEKNADLRPGKHHRVIKPLDSEKSGAILELVDIIDKGVALGPKKVSDCCSCCSCSSKSKILELDNKEQRGKRVYTRTYEEKYGVTGQTGTGTGEGVYVRKKYGKTGQTGTGEGVYETYEREFKRTVPGRMGERYNKRGVHFKAKHIRSDPCTCTFKFSGLIKKHSKAMFRKVHPPPLEEPYIDVEDQNIVENSKKKKFSRKSFQKYKDLRDKLEQDIRKLNESKANMKQNLQVRAKKSLEQVKQVKNKMKRNIESGVRKSIQAVKALHPKETLEPVEYPDVETMFKIKKDSIVKFKDYLKRKETMKDWECDLECEPDVCVPEECFRIIKLRRSHRRNRQRDRKYGAGYELIKREVKIGGAPLSRSNSGVQAEQFAITAATRIKKHKPMLRVDSKNQVMEKRLIFESERVHKVGGKKGVNKKVKTDKSVTPTHEERDFRDIKNKAHIETKNEILKGKGLVNKPRSRGRQAVRIKSSFSFDLEFYKNRPDGKLLRSSQPGIHVHAPRRKRRKIHRHHGSNVLSKSSFESSQGTPEHLKARLIQTDKYGRAPITSQGQLVSKISQCECEKRLSNVKTNTNYGEKSVSSTTNNVAMVDKNVSKEVKQKGRLSQVSLSPPARLDNLKLGKNDSKSHYKQAVRIGSTFSFNVEFYKNDRRGVPETSKSSIPQKPPKLITEKVIHSRSKHGQVKRKLVNVKGTSAKAYNQAKSTLHRCLCTLKLNKQVKTKRETKKGSKQKAPVPAMTDKYVETKNIRFEPLKPKYLLPYECEPGVCIPDECDPILCKNILDLRKQRFRRRISRSIGSYTGSRKTKSTSSIVSRPFSAARAKIVQSSIVPTKEGSTGTPRRYKNNFNLGRQELFENTALGRQAVRISSSFSFNIEFYKDTKRPAVGIAYKPSLSSMPPEVNYKGKKFKEQKKRDNKSNKAMFTKVTNIDKYIGPSLKNCLCTLKLYKNKVYKMKTVKKATKLTANTQTFGDAPIGELVDRGTRTKREHRYKLLPYECEPYTCVPGECDPYICLQNIKRRQLNTRDISVFTDRPDMQSMSSLTENSLTKSQAILVQPKLFGKGTNMKANYFETLDISRPKRENFHKASKSKQAVRIGSSFNFSIEFTKQSPGPVKLAKYPKIKYSPNVYPKMNRDKGITVTKVRVNHGDAQAQEPRKVNRTSLVRPMLKRCFCTLNLQNKTKQQYRKGKQENKYFGPQVYTVGRATTTKTKIITHSFRSEVNANLQFSEPKAKIISVSTSSFLLHNYAKNLKSKYETVKLYSAFRIPIQSKEPVVIKSNLSMKLGIVREVFPSKESKISYIKPPSELFSHASIDDLKLFNLAPNPRYRPGISRYLERCFCTMNVQIAKPEAILGLKKFSHKLKPYECEPGICIPGECDPYECKKFIMKRFTKNVHVSSGTKSKSISSYAKSNADLDSRSTQMQTRFRNHSQVTVPQRYKIQRQREAKQRQAVRLKSSFSFDLEFYKHRSRPIEKYINHDEINTNKKIPVNHKSIESVSKSTQENKIYRKGTKLQTTVLSLHKGTGSIAKRCFCTLKLQKKGRIYKQYEKFNGIPVKQLPSTTSRNVKIGTTNKYHKIAVDLNNLRFYECEPSICVPGQCDPYKCLELMQNRRNLGINTIRKEKISVPSMTSKEKFRTQAVDAVPVGTHHKATKTIKYVKLQNDSDIPHISGRNGRPVVRIGSSFSFNIEFYKDMPQELKYAETNWQMKKISNSASRQIQDKKELKAITSPSKKSIKSDVKETKAKKQLKVSRATVTEKSLNEAATVTKSFTSRCFCTANLRSTKIAEKGNKKSFKHKCFCLLGLRGKENKEFQTTVKIDTQSKENEKYQPALISDLQAKGNINNHLQIQPVTAEKPTNTNLKYKVFWPYLEPYECEPGICIPGKCDPYLCQQIMQQKLAKQRSIKSETEAVRTHSASSSFENYKQLKNERTQVQGQVNKKQIQHVTKDIKPTSKKTLNSEKRPTQIQHLSKDISSSIKKKLNADKRLVRIGSNFSFNIEFYKENMNGSVMKDKTSEKKSYPNTEVHNVKIPTKNVSKSIGTETVTEHRDKMQIKTKTSGVSPLLKRCFCTLKLMNKPFKQIDRTKTVNQLDTKPIKTTKTVETQSHKRTKGKTLQPDIGRENLSPYECEPFVCVPGQCDPVECFERIKRRQQQTKEIGTITKYPKRKTIGSVATRMKDENLQVKHLTPANKSIQKTSFVKKYWPEKSYHQPRQAVRIGSNFSFNIEFFKDTGDNVQKVVTNRPLEELNIEKYSKNIIRHHRKTQSSHFKRNIDSQALSKKPQTTETATAHLKQCFCTLPLRDKNLRKEENTSITIKSVQPKSDHSSVGHFLKKCICTLKLNKVGKQQNQPPAPAVKYEIKGTSTRSRRAPKVNIVKPVRLLEPYECEPYICVPGKCDPYECLKRIQRRQLRDFGTDYKRNVKDSATDSIKQPLTRSTKAQYHQKRKFNTKGTSSVSKRTRRSKEIPQCSYDLSHNTNRQVVRIGSNFSFNVEFFKDRGIPNTELKELNAGTTQKLKPVKLRFKRPEKPSTKSRGSISEAKLLRDKKSQCSYPRRHVPFPSTNIAPKRCFCTLKLLKQPNHPKSEVKLLSHSIPTKDKATATKIKYTIPREMGVYECPPLMCIPGECNPYECLEKIKKREIMRKSRNVGTRAARKSIACVGNGPSNVRAHKVQSQITKRRNVIASTPHSEAQSEILKSSRIIENFDRRNKCAVRIGSNFNFNVEFFKQKLQPVSPVSKIVKERSNEEDSYFNNKITAGARNFGHSYTNKTKLKDQFSNTENSLKRCFCTLQLQKPTNKKITGVKMNRPGNNLRYPQTFTVGRVSVEPCPNTVTKIIQTKKVDKARSTSIDSKLLKRTVGTRTHRKYLNFPSSQCNPNNCPDYQKKVLSRKTENDMQTILPFTPSKFNKESKTCVSTKNKIRKNGTILQLKGEDAHNPSDTSIVCKGRRKLTAKKSKKSIPTNSVMETESICKDSFFCRCVKFFSRRSETRSEGSDKQENMNNISKKINQDQDQPRSRTIPPKIKLTIPPKKAKSIGDNCPTICPKDTNDTGKRFSILQGGDVNNNIVKAFRRPKVGREKNVTFADNSEYPSNKMFKRKTNKSIHSESIARSRLCYSCSANNCPLNKGDLHTSGNSEVREKSIKSYKKAPSYSESVDDCQYCECCKRKINPDEISKGGGDRRLTISSQYKEDADSCPCGKEPIIKGKERTYSLSNKSRADNLSQKYSMKTDKCCSKIKPILEMRLDSDSHDIINKSEVKKNIEQFYSNSKLIDYTKSGPSKSKHRNNCICCKCIKKRKLQEATTTIQAKDATTVEVKGAKDGLGKFGNFFQSKNITKPPKKNLGSCVCGSKKCAIESKRKKRDEEQKGKVKFHKTCVCGSNICTIESRKIKKKRERAINKAKKKAQSIRDRKEMEAVNRRVKIQEEKDQIRRLKRIKRNRELERRVKQYKNSGDFMLAVDSLADIGRLGFSTLGDVLRYTTKAAVDPKVACERLCKKCRKKDPESFLKQLQTDYKESDAASTMRRLKMRCLFMQRVQSLKEKLEGNPITHFILHIADKNAKTRKFKRKPVRRIREPVDFQCSLYMATLRKRPYLSVYYKWPSFYPHFMTMLNIWRQFTDIMLFLLAAVVWSPCILCMEGCRALMCCFFCTG